MVGARNFSFSRASRLLPTRNANSRKGENGRVLVVGGSMEYFGSPALAGLAAMRAGIDLCYLFVPRFIAPTVAGYSPDLIVFSYDSSHMARAHVSQILDLEEKVDALVIGNGLTKQPSVLSAVRAVMREWHKPVVVDADAIMAKLSPASEAVAYTPHAVEFERLGGGKPSRTPSERVGQVQSLARSLRATVLLKGAVNVASDGKTAFSSSTGNSGMTVGGTGDTLAGIAGAFLSEKLSPLDAVSLAAYVNGAAGGLAEKKWGPSLLASDLVNEIPAALKRLRKA